MLLVLGLLGIFLSLLVLTGLAFLATDTFYHIRKYRYGVVERFGKRIRIVDEGLHVKIPFVDKVEVIKMKLYTIDITSSFTTKDNQRLTAVGSLQVTPDPKIVEIDSSGNPIPGRSIFDTIDEKTIKKGVDDAVSALLSGLGGAHTGQEFIEYRATIQNILNDYLCTSGLLSEGETTTNEHGEEVPVGPKEVLGWYRKRHKDVKDKFRIRSETTQSEFELRYGFRSSTFALADIDWDKETKNAMEERKQADYREQKLQKQRQAALAMMKEMKEVDPKLVQIAWDNVHVAMEPRTTKISTSVQGDSGILGALITGIAGKGVSK